MSLRIKFALFTSLLCLAIIGGISFFSYRIAYSDLANSIGERLEAVVRSGAVMIDGSLHDQVQGPEDAEGEVFLSIRQKLRELKEANDLSQEIYTMRRVGEEMRFVVMTNDKPFIGDPYKVRPEMLPTLNDGKPARTGVYQDTHGEWISAYAPIFDQDGNISGLLEADIRVEEFLALLRQKYTGLAWKYLIFAAIAVVLSFLLANSVTAKLNYLTDVTEKISLGKMDTRIQIKGKDEVAKLGASLERMRESLKIAAEMMD
jgi:HAMP domain-containing protein